MPFPNWCPFVCFLQRERHGGREQDLVSMVEKSFLPRSKVILLFFLLIKVQICYLCGCRLRGSVA